MANTIPVLKASNGCLAMIKEGDYGAEKGKCFLYTDARWPLDEFEELVAFVNDQRPKPMMAVPNEDSSDSPN